MAPPRSQEVFISVNSVDRLPGGSANKYTVQLPRQLRNVVMIELISAEIPNTLYTDLAKTLYFTVHVNRNYANPGNLLAVEEIGGLFVCSTTVPEGIYTHNDAATQLNSNIGIVKVYTVTDTIDVSNTNPAAGTEPIVDQTTMDIADVASSADSEESLAARGGEDPNQKYGEGYGILEQEANTDFDNDMMAYQPDRESELGFLGSEPAPDPTLVNELEFVKANLTFGFDPRLGKFYAQCVTASINNFLCELASTSPELGFTAHKCSTVNVVAVAGSNQFYAASISQLKSTSHIWMTIDELACMPYWNIMATHPLPRNVFARIQMQTDLMHWVFWSQGIEEFKRVCAPGMTAMLDRLTIGWLDESGNLTDFHGVEHSLVLKVTQSPPD